MKHAHTPGEWQFNENTNVVWSDIDRNSNNPRICTVTQHDISIAEMEANALLIAAAPYLLEALIEISKIVPKVDKIPRSEYDPEQDYVHLLGAERIALMAIAKATRP